MEILRDYCAGRWMRNDPANYFFSATAPAVNACATLEICAVVSSKDAL
jgi:hypothetical protein